MKKTGLKTFTISFSLTLFAICMANGLVVRERKIMDKKYASGKNISLFFKDNSETNYASVIPVKKVALSVLKEEIVAPIAEMKENIPLDINSKDDEQVIASVEELFDEPLVLQPAETKEIIVDNSYENKTPQINKDEIIMAKQSSPAGAEEIELAELLPAKYHPQEEQEVSAIPLERGGAPLAEKAKTQIASMEKSNQVAMNYAGKEVKEMASDGLDVKESEFDDKVLEPEWKTMKEVAQQEPDNPWVVAKGVKHPKNKLMLEEEYSQKSEQEVREVLSGAKGVGRDDETLASADMVKNLLIPIPQEIMSQENLTPQLVVEDDSAEKDKPEPEVGVSQTEVKEPVKEIKESIQEDKKGFLNSLKNIFSNSEEAKDDQGLSEFDGVDDDMYAELKRHQQKNANSRSNSEVRRGGIKKTTKILPTEMRLSFQPNRAEISGQTLRWIHAFANKVQDEQDLILEVRIDGSSSQELQHKRLNLLGNILKSKGLDAHKVNTIFTTREPNSFVIRAVKMTETRHNILVSKAKDKRTIPYYQQGLNMTPDNYQQW